MNIILCTLHKRIDQWSIFELIFSNQLLIIAYFIKQEDMDKIIVR